LANILWIIAGIFLALWILSIVLFLLGILVHIALVLLKYALIAAVVIVVFNLITGRKKI